MMCDWGDGREERLAALDLAMRLRRNPEVTRRRNAYNEAVRKARDYATKKGVYWCIDDLIKGNPAYVRGLLETEEERFGAGSIADRWARTHYEQFK